MKALVIGLGSMGKRRIRLIKQYNPDITIIGIDSRPDRRQEVAALYGVRSYKCIEMCDEEPDVAFVCTDPLSHHTLITNCLNRGMHVFSELNLFAFDYEKNIKLAREKGLKLFLSSTLLYRREIKYIEEQVNNSKKYINYLYHVGQYLPDWHPWENYQDFFVGNKMTNGCREFLAIELPWIQRVFGEIKNVITMKSKNSDLEIDYDDNYLILIEHVTGNKGVLAIDVISRKAVRNLEVFGDELYISWDGSVEGLFQYDVSLKDNKQIKLYNHVDYLEDYNKSIIENAYLNEVMQFFESLKDKKDSIYGFEEDLITIEWLNKIEGKSV